MQTIAIQIITFFKCVILAFFATFTFSQFLFAQENGGESGSPREPANSCPQIHSDPSSAGVSPLSELRRIMNAGLPNSGLLIESNSTQHLTIVEVRNRTNALMDEVFKYLDQTDPNLYGGALAALKQLLSHPNVRAQLVSSISVDIESTDYLRDVFVRGDQFIQNFQNQNLQADADNAHSRDSLAEFHVRKTRISFGLLLVNMILHTLTDFDDLRVTFPNEFKQVFARSIYEPIEFSDFPNINQWTLARIDVIRARLRMLPAVIGPSVAIIVAAPLDVISDPVLQQGVSRKLVDLNDLSNPNTGVIREFIVSILAVFYLSPGAFEEAVNEIEHEANEVLRDDRRVQVATQRLLDYQQNLLGIKLSLYLNSFHTVIGHYQQAGRLPQWQEFWDAVKLQIEGQR